MSVEVDDSRVVHGLTAGEAIEVRNRFDRRWIGGYEIAGANARGFRVRRRSDGRELPEVFAATEVRRRGSRVTWRG